MIIFVDGKPFASDVFAILIPQLFYPQTLGGYNYPWIIRSLPANGAGNRPRQEMECSAQFLARMIFSPQEIKSVAKKVYLP